MSGTIQFSGLGSGIDTASLIDQLISAERQSADTRISTSTSQTNAKISALGTIKSAFSSLQTALTTLRSGTASNARVATVGSGAGFTASAASTASIGSYSIKVEQLATAQKQISGALAGGSFGGDGTLSFSVGDDSFDVTVSSGDTLSTLAASINAAAAGKGLAATVVSVDGATPGTLEQRLVLTSATTGSAGVITAGGDPALIAALGLSVQTPAADAQVVIDGQTRTSSSNTLTDLLDGVTIKLTAADGTKDYSLAVASDTGSLSSSMAAFVTSYNSVLSALKASSSFTPGKVGGASGSQSALTGDAMVRSLQQQLRNMVGSDVSGLKALGVEIGKDGSLSLNSGTLSTAVAANPAAVSNLFGSSTGVSASMDVLLKGVLDGTSGLLKQRTDSLSKKLTDLSDQTTQLNLRMDQLKSVYTAKFSAMESIVTQMNSTSSYLTQQLSSLSKTLNSSSS